MCNVTLRHVCGKAISITYFECVFVALGVQHALYYIICGLPACTIFLHIIS